MTKSGEAGMVAFSPLRQQFAAILFRFAVEVVALFLGGGGEQDVGRGTGGFAGGNELLHQAYVGVVDHLRVAVAVHGRQVHNGIAVFYEGLKFFFLLKEIILTGDALKGVGLQAPRCCKDTCR
jgi:hypothetical protein